MREIPGFPGYFATEDGNIFSKRTNKFIKKRIQKRGYEEVKLVINVDDRAVGKTCLVHRLICYAFYGRSTMTVDHINNVKDDNRIENLRYVTAQENHAKAVADKSVRFGPIKRRLFTDEQVRVIRKSELSLDDLVALFPNRKRLDLYKVKTYRTYCRVNG